MPFCCWTSMEMATVLREGEASPGDYGHSGFRVSVQEVRAQTLSCPLYSTLHQVPGQTSGPKHL
jgi:hypothetical protein